MKKSLPLTITLLFTMVFINSMGQQWEFVRQSDNGKTLKAISFTDSINGWMVRYDDANTILRTKDKGETWTEEPIQSIQGASNFHDVHFFNESEGFILDGQNLQKTMDGGKTWSQVVIPTAGFELLLKLVFRDSIGYIMGQNGSILKSVDKGNTWEAKGRVDVSVTKFQQSHGMDFFNDKAVVVGMINGPDEFAALTSDGAETWSERNLGGSWDVLNTVFYADENTVFAAGRNGAVLKSLDAGESWKGQWTDVGPSGNMLITGMYFLNKDTGWLVGTTVTDNIMNIIRTYDGGKNWNEEFSSAAAYYKWKVEDITYSKDGTLWVCGYAGLASNRGEFILKRSLQTKPPVGIVKNTSIRSFKNYPNPFTEETTIKVEFPQQEDIELKVYNSLGQLVENIFQGSINPGTHLFQFEPSVSRAGFYFGVLKTKNESFTLKMNKSE